MLPNPGNAEMGVSNMTCVMLLQMEMLLRLVYQSNSLRLPTLLSQVAKAAWNASACRSWKCSVL